MGLNKVLIGVPPKRHLLTTPNTDTAPGPQRRPAKNHRPSNEGPGRSSSGGHDHKINILRSGPLRGLIPIVFEGFPESSGRRAGGVPSAAKLTPSTKCRDWGSSRARSASKQVHQDLKCPMSRTWKDTRPMFRDTAAVTTTRSTFKIEDPSPGLGRVDFGAPDEGFGFEGTPKP